jgi:hypothetical protein
MWIKITVLAVTIPALMGAYWLGSNAFFLETASYSLVLQEGSFEIREYPELPVASTTNEFARDDSAFRRLFQYIQGSNSEDQKIAMTTPVFVDEERMSFVIPEDVEKQGIPDPTTEGVQVERRPSVRVAVYRFSGAADEQSRNKALQKLVAWMNSKGLESQGAAIFAYYDAPFVPGPFRRNEVMLQSEQAKAS